MIEEGYDLLIRINPAPTEQLVGRRVLNDERLIVAPPNMPCPSAPTRDSSPGIAVKAVLLANTPPETLWRLRPARGGKALVIRPEPMLRLSSLLMVRDAVLAGAGPALLPKLLVADDIAAGRLDLWGIQDWPPVQI